MFQTEVAAEPVLFVIIYRPPQSYAMFLNQFADFLGGVVTKFDKILLLGDFNIHVCCPNGTLPRVFCNLTDLLTLNFTLQLQGPIHIQGHTLDLDFSHGFSTLDTEICDTGFSDHKSVIFTTTLPGWPAVTTSQIRWTRHFTASAADEFALDYTSLHISDSVDSSPGKPKCRRVPLSL